MTRDTGENSAKIIRDLLNDKTQPPSDFSSSFFLTLSFTHSLIHTLIPSHSLTHSLSRPGSAIDDGVT